MLLIVALCFLILSSLQRLFLAGVLVVWSQPASADQVSDTADAIRIEATRSNDDPEGRPLPLATHWTTGSTLALRVGDRRGKSR